MIHEENHACSGKDPMNGDELWDETLHAKCTMSCVWALIIVEIALTLLAGYALWAKTRGISPFVRTEIAPLNDRNDYHAPEPF